MKLVYITLIGLLVASCGPSEADVDKMTSELDNLMGELEKEVEKVKDPNRYYNDDLNISVINNEGWEIKENQEDIPVFFMSPLDGESDLFQENINMVNESAPGYTLDQYYDANLRGIDLYLQGFKVLEEPIMIKIDGHDFKKMVYEHTSSGLKVKVLVYFAVKGGKGYVINCTALEDSFDEFKPQFEKLAESFKFE